MNHESYEGFGKGNGPTSRLLYHHSFQMAFERIEIPEGTVYDLGGGSKILQQFIPNQVISVDMNPDMKPDILCDILDFDIPADAGFLVVRHVLHYLDWNRQHELLHKIKMSGIPCLLIQFANEDISQKAIQTSEISIDSKKHFITPTFLEFLIKGIWSNTLMERLYRIDYEVEPEFYQERFGIPGKYTHGETLYGYWLK